jgi:hypothetical protein
MLIIVFSIAYVLRWMALKAVGIFAYGNFWNSAGNKVTAIQPWRGEMS